MHLRNRRLRSRSVCVIDPDSGIGYNPGCKAPNHAAERSMNMELGQKIKQLRFKAGLTQDQLAQRLGVTPQSVSKWENAVSMPDIALLPALAGEFGVSIDDLFDLSAEQKLQRIENRMDTEEELPGDLFLDYGEYLREQLNTYPDRGRILSLLGHLYHHRMEADARKVSRYAREAIRLAPGEKDCQWLLQMAEGHHAWDWNCSNHSRAIEFYRDLISGNEEAARSPLPYYYLIDNLIADHRAGEAREVLEACRKLPEHKPILVTAYEAHIALAEYDEAKADGIIETGKKQYPEDSGFFFEAAQYHAWKGEYPQAIACYEIDYASDARPRYIDALQGIAMIYEILGEYGKAAAAYDRILENLREEWGFTEETAIQEAEAEKRRLLERAR